ncbi:MAG: FHA domain-containing protein [Propionibacterium sp.]|nr:FHA domain-containing protein [Propionibacterium sp.]
MQIRVTLLRGGAARNILIRADATATATDVANAILSEGLSEPFQSSEGRPTLRVQDPLGRARVLAADAAVSESGVQSGGVIEVVREQRGAVDEIGAVLRVVAGPDAGAEVPLRFGSSRIGRSPQSDVRLTDPRVSKSHARVLVGAGIDIIDDDSANGVVVGDQRVTRATLGAGDIAVLGGTQVRIDAVGNRSGQSLGTEVAFMRPPRVLARPTKTEVELPEVPEPPNNSRFPWISLVAPIVMGVGMYVFTRSPMTLMFVALSPVLMIGNYVSQRIDGSRKRKADLVNFTEGMRAAEEEMAEAQALETRQLQRLYPATDECIEAATQRNGALWCRHPEHPEFLQVRIGAGSVRALHQFSKPGRRRGFVHLQRQQTELRERYRLLHNTPSSLTCAPWAVWAWWGATRASSRSPGG